jgi:adenylate kinase family enzyme
VLYLCYHVISRTVNTYAPFSYIEYVTKKVFSAIEFPVQFAALRNRLLGKDERGADDELRLQFEAVSRFDPEEKHVVRLYSTA